MSTRGKLENTVLAPVDLRDQPDLPMIFLIDTSAGGRQAFTVDNFDVGDGIVRGLRQNKPVIAVPVATAWTVLHRDLVMLRTVEESIRKQKTDFDVQAKLVEQLGSESVTPPALPPTPPLDLLGQYL